MTAYSVRWAVTAREDLKSISAHISGDGPLDAMKVVQRIEALA